MDSSAVNFKQIAKQSCSDSTPSIIDMLSTFPIIKAAWHYYSLMTSSFLDSFEAASATQVVAHHPPLRPLP